MLQLHFALYIHNTYMYMLIKIYYSNIKHICLFLTNIFFLLTLAVRNISNDSKENIVCIHIAHTLYIYLLVESLVKFAPPPCSVN